MSKGKLFIVSTPIGNLDDMTYRAVKTLKESDIIYAESIGRARKLLLTYDINVPVKRYYDKNKERITPSVIELLKEGKICSLITDAGTPGISDPGFYLIRESIKEEIDVIPIPGVSAVITALSVSGLPTDRFTFAGFLSRKKGKRKKELYELLQRKDTIVFYESPYRIVKLMEEINELFPDRPICIAREMTKMYETFYRGNAKDILDMIKNKTKGEFVAIIGGNV